MAARPVRLDSNGIGDLLKSSAMRSAVDKAANAVAENARDQGHTVESGEALPVTVTSYTTDRAAASVALAHPAGVAMQAKYGVLTKAASDAGMEVKGS